MSDTYMIDTMVVINLHRILPRDVWPSVWDRVEKLVADGRGFTLRQVIEELEKVDDECGPWAKGLDGFVMDAEEPEIRLVSQITKDHPGWVQEGSNDADPWVIAHAAVHACYVVTEERAKGPGTPDEKLKIPNVAAEHNVECMNFNDLARREGWVF
jgi:Domain of unknown function (DUF4411)